MKPKKTKLPNKIPAAAGVVPTLLRMPSGAAVAPVSTPLRVLVSAFLTSTAHLHCPHTRQRYYVVLNQLAAHFGHQPINQVSGLQIKQLIMSNQSWGSRTRLQARHYIKTFYHWARDHGHLAKYLPTAADMVDLQIQVLPPPIILASRLEQLLRSTRDPDILMPTVFFAFAGPLVAELQRLERDNIQPGCSLFIERHNRRKKRVVQILAVLDAWVRPFYRCPDLPFLRPSALKKFRRWARVQNLRLFARILRNSFIAHHLEQSGNSCQTAHEAGLRVKFCHKFFTGLVARGSAGNYFSLTPDQVGLYDWPSIVKEYLARKIRSRREAGRR